MSDERLGVLDEFCDVAGASRSGVIDVLIRDYLDDLIDDVSKLAKDLGEEEEDEGDEEEEDEEEEEEEE